MVETQAETKLKIGDEMPHIKLIDVVSERLVDVQNQFKGRCNIIVVMWLCNHCPFVSHILPELITVNHDYCKDKVQFIAISSNDWTSGKYFEDAPESLKETAKKFCFDFPYLLDNEQTVAKSFGATCTPSFWVFGSEFKLAWFGGFDESTPGNNKPVSGFYLRSVINSIINKVKVPDFPPCVGCAIKWKEGNEP